MNVFIKMLPNFQTTAGHCNITNWDLQFDSLRHLRREEFVCEKGSLFSIVRLSFRIPCP